MKKVSNSSGSSTRNDSSAKKKPVFLFLFIGLSAYFALACVPFLAATANPDQNIGRIRILYANFDGGIVGNSLDQFIQYVPSQISTPLPSFYFVQATSSVNDLQNQVLNQDGWAAIYSTPGASTRLNNSLINGCSGFSSYDATQGLGVIWDEGRSPTTSPKIFALITGILDKYSNYFSSQLLTELNVNQISGCKVNNAEYLLSVPVSYTVNNLTPVATKAPVVTSALTVGNILIAVFASLYTINPLYKAVDVSGLTVLHTAIYRAALLFLYNFGLSCVFSTAIVGLAKTGSGNYLYSGAVWAQGMAIQWCQGLIWSFGIASIAEGISVDVVALPVAFLLMSSIIGGWNTDLSYPAYHNFYQIFPFNWAIILMKFIYFGSGPNLVTLAACVLTFEAVFFILLFFYLALKPKNKGTSVFSPSDVDSTSTSKCSTNNSTSTSTIATIGGGYEEVTSYKESKVGSEL